MEDLSPRHHALFFAWTVEEVFNCSSQDEAGRIIKEAVVEYGRERGRRMAYRARENGRVLNMTTYLDCIEWQADADEAEWVIEVKNENTYTKVFKCPWNTAWQESDTVNYGKYYCKYIDSALIEGFNPELKIEVKSTLSEGKDCCQFVYNEGVREASFFKYVLPWDYHVAHLAYSLKETLSRLMTEEVAVDIIYKAINKFKNIFGEEACLKVIRYENTDFSRG